MRFILIIFISLLHIGFVCSQQTPINLTAGGKYVSPEIDANEKNMVISINTSIASYDKTRFSYSINTSRNIVVTKSHVRKWHKQDRFYFMADGIYAEGKNEQARIILKNKSDETWYLLQFGSNHVIDSFKGELTIDLNAKARTKNFKAHIILNNYGQNYQLVALAAGTPVEAVYLPFHSKKTQAVFTKITLTDGQKHTFETGHGSYYLLSGKHIELSLE